MTQKNSRVVEMFLDLVRINTRSKQGVEEHPSTPGQLEAISWIREHMEGLGYACQQFDWGTLMVTIPASAGCTGMAPIAWAAHVDTHYAISGDVTPVIYNYVEGDLELCHDGVVIQHSRSPCLQKLAADGGGEVIASDGTSLLGADDKAGCAAMLKLAYSLAEDGNNEHPEVLLFFCTDEEVGQFGGDLPEEVMNRLAVFNTLDGITLGTIDIGSARIERRIINASSLRQEQEQPLRVTVIFTGKSAHPGPYPDSYRPALAAACHLAALVAEQVEETVAINEISGSAASAKLVLGTSVDFQGQLNQLVMELLQDHAQVTFSKRVKAGGRIAHFPHLISIAKLVHIIQVAYPVQSYRGPAGDGYIVAADLKAEGDGHTLICGVASTSPPGFLDMVEEVDGTIVAVMETMPECVRIDVDDVVICASVTDAIDRNPRVINPLLRALEQVIIPPKQQAIAGGTDGGMLNLRFPDLPCPNIGTGTEMMHDPMEHIGLHDLERLAEFVVWATHYYAEMDEAHGCGG
ncbi:M20/M25/M40 family metallo-hydrolase [Patescibacteria group bacterium]